MYIFKHSGTQLIGTPMGYENLAVIQGDHIYEGTLRQGSTVSPNGI